MIRDRDFDRRRWVEPGPDNEQNDATWEQIGKALDEPKRSLMLPLFGVALAAAAAMWLVLRSPDVEWNEGDLVAGQQAVAVRMEDGSSVEASPHSRVVRRADRGGDVHLQVLEGEATFDVERDAEREFVVHAGEVEVVVVGTRFSVERGDVVTVSVERGAVEIRRDGATFVVSAGEIWREPQATDELARAEDVSIEVATAAEESPGEEQADEAGVEGRGERAREPSRREARPSATRLFEEAQSARRDGRPAEASRTYADFLRNFPSHNNAPLAAFELGRLKMDLLGDPRGAARVFERAARRGSPFRQDAMARRVQALAASGDSAGCARARTLYETTFPNGRHQAMLTSACD